MSNRVSPVVYGIETEYSHMIGRAGGEIREIVGACHSQDVGLGLYEAPDDPGTEGITGREWVDAAESVGLQMNNEGMLSNGGKFYLDVSGVEYCTPETTTAEEAVVRSFDGDEIVLAIMKNLCDEEVIASAQINRRIVDHNRQSRGVHLNTATKLKYSDDDVDEFVARLAAMNVAKGSIFGSGGLLVDERGNTNFHHSPRLSITDRTSLPAGHYYQRMLVRVPFKTDMGGISRVESVSGDALNFAWPLRGSLVLTKATIGLLELGHHQDLPRLVFGSEVNSAHFVGRHGHEARLVVDVGDAEPKKFSPLDIIRQYAQVALAVNETEGFLDDEALQVLPEIIETADMMTDDIFSVADRVESAYRLLAMIRKMEADHIPISSEKMCRFDYAWDKVGGGIAETLRSRGRGWHGFSPRSHRRVYKERLVPPQDTRARIRGNFILQAEGTDCSNWTQIGNTEADWVRLHPLVSNADEVDALAKPRVRARLIPTE